MNIANLVSPDGTVTTVTADGKPLGNGDLDKRVLHILPKVFVPSYALSRLKPIEVILEVESTLPLPMLTLDEIVVRQPYPNNRYLVGGSETSRNGWLIDLPDDVYEFDLTFKWEFFHAWKFSPFDALHIEHLIHVKLLPGEFRTYTMDSSCWPRVQASEDPRNPSFRGTAVSLLGLEGDEDLREDKLRDIVKVEDLVWKRGEEITDDFAGQLIEERLTIPAQAYEKVWSLHAFDQEQLHEIKHSSKFSTYLTEHQDNAEHEMPASVLLKAINQAREIPFGKESEYSGKGAGKCESHPAMITLNQWWEESRTDNAPMKAGFAMPWVRARDDDEYWCGYGETPNEKISNMGYEKKSAARVGDAFLLIYSASHEHFVFNENHYLQTFLADGQKYAEVGVSKEDVLSGEWDEAWFALEALAGIPGRFPEAYKALQKQLERVDK